MWEIPLFDLNYGPEEQQAVMEVLENKWLTAGPKTRAFESEFAGYLGNDVQCRAVSNGTAALHLALLCAGVTRGHEVIVSGLTFVADLNVVVFTGATPVTADISSLHDWNVSPEDVEKKITEKTRAVIAVHYAGWPCDMAALTKICRKNGLVLIEDAAHAPGSEYEGQKCGTIGDMGCFSFFSNKNLSTGEGGMLCSRDPDIIEKAGLLRSHGMTSLTIDRYEGRTISYDVLMPGLNYRTDEIKSALGLVQLAKLDSSNRKRLELYRRYIRHLKPVDGIYIPWMNFPENTTGSGHIFPVMLKDHSLRERFIERLKENGIQTSIHYPAFNRFSYYRKRVSGLLPVADRVSSGMVTLPLYPDLAFKDLDHICRIIQQFFDPPQPKEQLICI